MTTIREAMEPLDGAGIHLRPATAADDPALATILRDPTVGAWWQAPDVEADVAELLDDNELAIWLIEEAGTVLGLIMAGEETDPMYRHASIDIAIVAAGQGRGLGSDAVRTVARWLIDAARPPSPDHRPVGRERAGDRRLREGRVPTGRDRCAATSAGATARGTTAS